MLLMVGHLQDQLQQDPVLDASTIIAPSLFYTVIEKVARKIILISWHCKGLKTRSNMESNGTCGWEDSLVAIMRSHYRLTLKRKS